MIQVYLGYRVRKPKFHIRRQPAQIAIFVPARSSSEATFRRLSFDMNGEAN